MAKQVVAHETVEHEEFNHETMAQNINEQKTIAQDGEISLSETLSKLEKFAIEQIDKHPLRTIAVFAASGLMLGTHLGRKMVLKSLKVGFAFVSTIVLPKLIETKLKIDEKTSEKTV